MSEPLTSHEIEDVLSSIRRLVSEDLRPAARAAGATARPVAESGEEAGKLLLTPALRVVAAPEAVAEPAPEPAPEALAEPVPDLAAAAFPVADEVYDDIGPNAPTDGPAGVPADSGPALAFESSPHTVAAARLVADEDDLIWSSAGVDPADEAPDMVVEDTIDEPAPLPRRESHGHWTAQDLPGMDWGQDDSDWAEPEALPFVAHSRRAEFESDPLARAWADRAEAEVRAQLHLGAEARVAPAATPAAPPAAPAEEALGAPPGAPTGGGGGGASGGDGPGLFDADEPEIDEDMLREIVRDIIREELAGTLGERITRNVRKLVRVEINRALTAREFE